MTIRSDPNEFPTPNLQRIVEDMAPGEPRSEIRLRDGAPDDIVLDGGDLHLEDMDGKSWWLGFYRDGKRTTFRLRSKSKITVTVEENELGAALIEQDW
jgi:hypothetical protein